MFEAYESDAESTLPTLFRNPGLNDHPANFDVFVFGDCDSNADSNLLITHDDVEPVAQLNNPKNDSLLEDCTVDELMNSSKNDIEGEDCDFKAESKLQKKRATEVQGFSIRLQNQMQLCLDMALTSM